MPAKLRTIALASASAGSHSRAAANRLRSLRCELGLSQAEAARLAGVSREAWSKWERARVAMPALEALCALERAAQREAA